MLIQHHCAPYPVAGLHNLDNTTVQALASLQPLELSKILRCINFYCLTNKAGLTSSISDQLSDDELQYIEIIVYEGLIDREPNDQGNNIVNILVNTIVLYNINKNMHTGTYVQYLSSFYSKITPPNCLTKNTTLSTRLLCSA